MERVRINGMQDPTLELDPNHVFRMEVTQALTDAGATSCQIDEATGRIFDAANRRNLAIGNRTQLQRPDFPEADL